MTSEAVAALGGALAGFLRAFSCCFPRRPTFNHFLTYCRGLLSNAPRKSVEPLALAADTSVRTLQVFLSGHVWEHDRLRDLMQQRIAREHGPAPGSPGSPGMGLVRNADDIGTVGIIDETGHVKKGDKTPGVQRQYCGHSGKIDNCIVTVHLGYAWGDFQTLIDRDLFLPQAWCDDRVSGGRRCRDAGIPDDLTHRPKWRVALEQVRRALGNGVHFDWLTFDEEYGKVPEFLFELESLGQTYIGEVPPTFLAWGRQPRYRSLRKEHAPSQVRHLVRWSEKFIYTDWQDVWLDRKTLGPQLWRVKAAQVHRVRGKSPHQEPTDRTYWLIHAWQPDTGESKYLLSNAPPHTPLAVLMKAAFSRARIEHCFRIAKDELGLSHFEGRSYVALMRHLTLCQLLMLFLAEQSDLLRGEKSTGDGGADGPCPAGDLCTVA